MIRHRFRLPRIDPGSFVPWVAGLLCLGSGALNIASVATPALPERLAVLRELFPLEFIHLSRSLVLIAGLALVVIAVNVIRRKRRAMAGAIAISGFAVFFHLSNGINWEESAVALALIVLLATGRKFFTIGGGVPRIAPALLHAFMAVSAALVYGIAGFWFLDNKDFGLNFEIADAIHHTLHCLVWLPDAQLVPRTHFAGWFLDSLSITSCSAAVLILASLFNPVLYRFRTQPRERLEAKAIVEKHGRSSMEFFKYWPDKSYFFLPDRSAFVAYRVSGDFAITLADPVGPAEVIEQTIEGFIRFCENQGWRAGFHQTLPDFLPIYEKQGFRKVKIGDDAIVDLAAFTLEGRGRKELRHTINRMEAEGIRFVRWEPPIPDEVLLAVSTVSDEWLNLPGRRERRFTLGVFDLEYVRSTPVCAALDKQGSMLGFVNIIPSYAPGEATIDLMRRRTEVPDGLMDFIFTNLILSLKKNGFTRFNLGMAPLGGFTEHEDATAEERAIHAFFSRLNFLFSYQGLRHFKAKYAAVWEPRYDIVRSIADLPRLLMALSRVAEVKHDSLAGI